MNDDGIRKLFDRVDVLDVADLRSLTKLLWKQREFLKKTFDIIRDGVVVVNGKGEIFYCNRAARELLGIGSLKPSNTLWKYIPEFVAFTDFDFTFVGASDSFFSKEVKISYPKKGTLSVTVTRGGGDYEGEERMFVLRIADVTEERASSEKTLNDEKISSITLLASGVAHEIGNPLNAIILRLQLLQRQLKSIKDFDERRKFEASVGVCLDEISRLDGIVRNFLQAIRPQKPRMLDVSLNKVLANAISLMDAEFRSLNIEVISNLDQLPLILGDFAQLKQVFFNILKNSCEAICGGGTIVIDGTFDDSDVVLVFTDNGIGIPCEVFNRGFQPYFSTKAKGNGLGMVIVERILRGHDASISVASTKNVGTKITINFPRKDRSVPLLNSDNNG
ncbi:MAG: PAS domain-containing protein [Puniceicoccales bacterium]|jgi:signal transduction histidine kinase|nr:PAS domain-containing protein [Puniceicoccales bacterium]